MALSTAPVFGHSDLKYIRARSGQCGTAGICVLVAVRSVVHMSLYCGTESFLHVSGPSVGYIRLFSGFSLSLSSFLLVL